RKPLDGAAIEPQPMADGRVPMADRDRDVFGIADDVGELQPDKANIVAFDDVIDTLEFIFVVMDGALLAGGMVNTHGRRFSSTGATGTGIGGPRPSARYRVLIGRRGHPIPRLYHDCSTLFLPQHKRNRA